MGVHDPFKYQVTAFVLYADTFYIKLLSEILTLGLSGCTSVSKEGCLAILTVVIPSIINFLKLIGDS